MKTEEIMSSPVVVTKDSTKLKHTRELFSRNSINTIPVLKKDGERTSMLGSSDFEKSHDDTLCVANK